MEFEKIDFAEARVKLRELDIAIDALEEAQAHISVPVCNDNGSIEFWLPDTMARYFLEIYRCYLIGKHFEPLIYEKIKELTSEAKHGL